MLLPDDPGRAEGRGLRGVLLGLVLGDKRHNAAMLNALNI